MSFDVKAYLYGVLTVYFLISKFREIKFMPSSVQKTLNLRPIRAFLDIF